MARSEALEEHQSFSGLAGTLGACGLAWRRSGDVRWAGETLIARGLVDDPAARGGSRVPSVPQQAGEPWLGEPGLQPRWWALTSVLRHGDLRVGVVRPLPVSPVTIHVIGDFRVTGPDGALLIAGAERAAPWEALLRVAVAGAVSRGRLADDMWHGLDEHYQRDSLRQALRRLRQQWTRTTGVTDEPVVEVGGLLTLNAQAVSFDVDEARRVASHVRALVAAGDLSAAGAFARDALRRELGGPPWSVSNTDVRHTPSLARVRDELAEWVAELADAATLAQSLEVRAEAGRRLAMHTDPTRAASVVLERIAEPVAE